MASKPATWKELMNLAMSQAKEDGVMIVGLAIDTENESVEVLYNPQQADQNYAEVALCQFVDGMRGEQPEEPEKKSLIIH